jgi:DNA-binding transcriptional ArsR family regulator
VIKGQDGASLRVVEDDVEGFGGDAEAAGRAVQLLKALSHAGRLQMLCMLVDTELSVGHMAEMLGLAQASASQQLMRLRAEGFVAARRQGKTIYYRLARQDVVPVIRSLRDLFCAPETP